MPTLSEHESKQLLGGFGVPTPAEEVTDDADEAVGAAERIGGPVALKLCGARIAHKTERGLLRLGVEGADAVRSAAQELFDAVTPDDGACQVLVAPMVRGNREFIAGLQRDPQFGMTVMLGVGGILAEAVADVSFRLVPISRIDAQEMIEGLSTQRLLGEFRGEPAVDRERLVDVLMGLSEASVAHPEIEAADLNPLIVVDGSPVAVDALVEIGEA